MSVSSLEQGSREETDTARVEEHGGGLALGGLRRGDANR